MMYHQHDVLGLDWSCGRGCVRAYLRMSFSDIVNTIRLFHSPDSDKMIISYIGQSRPLVGVFHQMDVDHLRIDRVTNLGMSTPHLMYVQKLYCRDLQLSCTVAVRNRL